MDIEKRGLNFWNNYLDRYFMSKILVKRGGNSAVSQYIGESGELIFDTTNKRLSVGDGSTKGGIQIANVSDLSNNNPTSYVVKTYSSGTNWYRKYNDGWIEQGGNIQVNYNSIITVTLPLKMSTTTYTIVLGNNGGVESSCNVPANTATVSGFNLRRYYTGSERGSGPCYWYVSGK